MPTIEQTTLLQPGDLLWFCGRGFESRAIALWTTSLAQKWRGELISHVGIVAMGYGNKPVLFESTTLNDKACAIQHRQVNGVQAQYPHERINDYGGRVYRSRLKKPLDKAQSESLTVYLADMLGTPYDYRQALLSGTTWIKRLFGPDDQTLFCDELVAFALMEIGVVPQVFNPSSVTPAWLARWLVSVAIYDKLCRIK